ncbi:hypothetical protein AMECASPLE_037996 [Ameca splendens]|uniref:Uncharacterized protein n=1 Tax=Ameca splendens TaxID=208324 RepID=A0ABV1A3G8_9TELE
MCDLKKTRWKTIKRQTCGVSHLAGNLSIMRFICLACYLKLVYVCPCVCFAVKVMKFNKEQAAPDVSQEEHSHTYTVTSVPTETGFRYDKSQRHTNIPTTEGASLSITLFPCKHLPKACGETSYDLIKGMVKPFGHHLKTQGCLPKEHQTLTEARSWQHHDLQF